jgi:hypothetical protein
MPSFVHILNPVNPKAGSDLEWIQRLTFASIQKALQATDKNLSVSVMAACYPEDASAVPQWMECHADLSRSVLDFTGKSGRKLPVLQDILQTAYARSEADYIIFSNLDICLMPSFYRLANFYAEQGLDAFAINRRRIHDQWKSPDELELMYAEAGEAHPGYDMIVFRRKLLPEFELGNVCIGVPFFDTVLMHNLYVHAENFRLMTAKHLTFHVGMELIKQWGNSDECNHNAREYAKVREKLFPLFSIEKFPGADLPFLKRHFKWLFNPTFHYPTMLRLDFAQFGRQRPSRKYFSRIDESKPYHKFLVGKINFDDEF